MRAALRNLTVWSLMLAVAAGSWLPAAARLDAVDADGVCGALLILPDSVGQLTTSPDGPAPGHCAVCHLRQDRAGAFVSSVVQLVLTEVAMPALDSRPTRSPNAVVLGDAPPRGPPVTS